MNTANLKDRLEGKLQARTPEPVPQARQPEPMEERIINMPVTALPQATALSPVSSDYIALTNNALDIINANLKNQPLTHQLFDVVKSPTGGMTVFTVPGLSGDEIQKELLGIILDYCTPRAFWESPEPIEGTPPVCYSRDSIVSHEGKSCNTCVYNTFGSKDGDSPAKACKEAVEVYLLRPDNIMPIIVRIPVTSKYIFQRYLTRLISRMIPLSGVVTRITLEKATSKGGQPYAQFNFEAVNILEPDEASYAKAYGKKFSDMLHVNYESETMTAV